MPLLHFILWGPPCIPFEPFLDPILSQPQQLSLSHSIKPRRQFYMNEEKLFEFFDDEDELINFPPNEATPETYDDPSYTYWAVMLSDNIKD